MFKKILNYAGELYIISLRRKENKTRERGTMPSPQPSTHSPSKGLAKDAPPNTTNDHHQHLCYIMGLVDYGERP
jgi:hypothetical protein